MSEQTKDQILGMVRLLSMFASAWMIKKGWAQDETQAMSMSMEYAGYALGLGAAIWSIIRKRQRRTLEVKKIETAILSPANATVESVERKVAIQEAKTVP